MKFKNVKLNQIADSLHGSISISYVEKKIISTQAFNRLHNVHQNSTAYLTFPSNRTKRFEHALGVMYLGGQIFYHSILNSDSHMVNKFFDCINNEIEKIFKNDGFRIILRQSLGDQNMKLLNSYKDILIDDPYYKSILPKIIDDKHIFAYCLVFQAIRLSALLHDVGHPPFSHVIENAMKNIWENINGKNGINEREEEFLKATDLYSNYENMQLHEKIGLNITNKLLEHIIGRSASNESEAEEKLFYWLLRDFVKSIYEEKGIFENIHRIIDSSIDCDRLDYISRDMANSGFSFGFIEYDRLISSMVLCYHDETFIFCPKINVLNTVEDILHRRWKLYKNLIFHHRVSKTDRLLENVIIKLAEDYFNFEQDEKSYSTNQVLPIDISGIWKAISEVISNQDYFNALIQWDDAWLLTVMRYSFFEKYCKDENNIRYQMEELLSNKKYYRSMIKRMDYFLELDKALINKFSIEKLKEIEKIVGDSWKPFLNKIQNHLEDYKKTNFENIVPFRGFFLNELKALFATIGKTEEFYKMLESSICSHAINMFKAKDCFVIFNKKVKTGLEKHPPVLYQKGEIIELKQVSKIEQELKLNQQVFSLFYIYIREGECIPHKEYIYSLGEKISQNVIEFIDDLLKD